jgi:hypothetical protein
MSRKLDEEINSKRLRNRNKLIGEKIIEEKIKYCKLREKNNKSFNEAIIRLNKLLKNSESLLQINSHYPKKNGISSFLPKNESNYLKKINYYNKWHFILPKINNNNIKKENNKDDNIHNIKSRNKFLKGIFLPHYKEEKGKDNIFSKTLEYKKHNINANQIVKRSIQELNKKNKFKKYCYNLEEKVGNYVECNEISNYYDFDKEVKKDIKNEMIGIDIPGNTLNRDSIGFIKTLLPKNIKIRIKKSISVPEKTLLPVPQGLVGKGNYTHITIKSLYKEKIM